MQSLLAAELDTSIFSLPFELPQTQQRYPSIYRQFPDYIFRFLVLSPTINEHTNNILGLQLTSSQLAMMEHIQDHSSIIRQQADPGFMLQPSPDNNFANLFQDFARKLLGG